MGGGRTDDHVHPLQSTEDRSVLDDVLVRREHDLEVIRPELRLQHLALRRVALVRDHLHARRPLGKLARPVGHRR